MIQVESILTLWDIFMVPRYWFWHIWRTDLFVLGECLYIDLTCTMSCLWCSYRNQWNLLGSNDNPYVFFSPFRKMADGFSVSVLCLFSYLNIYTFMQNEGFIFCCLFFNHSSSLLNSPTTWLPLASSVQWGLVRWSLVFPATGLGRKPGRERGLTNSNPFTKGLG